MKKFLAIVAITIAALLILSGFDRWRLRRFWSRRCTDAQWRDAFPTLSTGRIHAFLDLVASAFALNESRRLCLAPSDQLMALYRALYPRPKLVGDAMELELLLGALEARYGVDVSKIQLDDITLGQLLLLVQSPHNPSTDPPKRRQRSPESGKIHFDGTSISYTSTDYGSFSVALSDVVLIGEFTTDNGPFIDDWFLVIVPRHGTDWHEASMYAQGIDPLRTQLSEALGSSIYGPTLFASTDFASRILWPAVLAERPLFTFCKVEATELLQRIKLALSPEVSRTLSPDALSQVKASA